MRPRHAIAHCFLCQPEPEWTWHESPNFRAVLGLGPIGHGFTLIAARDHVLSMLDIEPPLVDELETFTAEVRARLEQLSGPAVIGEHGRVAPCVGPVVRRHDPHCLHAHRLVFPGHAALDLRAVAPTMKLHEYGSFRDAHTASAVPGQYLFAETPDGRCQVGAVDGPLPRQFLRAVVAAQQGRPDLADWQRSPRRDEVNAAAARLMPARAA